MYTIGHLRQEIVGYGHNLYDFTFQETILMLK